MASPFPKLQVWTSSGLTFPWAEVGTKAVLSSSDAHLGPDGVGCGFQMYVYWQDLENALTQLLGYSWRDTTSSPGVLRRKLPWQHPYFYTLFVKAVTSVKGVRMEGTNIADPEDLFTSAGAGLGKGLYPNTGPWTEYRLALLTIQFWRPPYYVRSDSDILDVNNKPQEWLRYLDREWQVSAQMLSRESGAYAYQSSSSPPNNLDFPGSVGQQVCHDRVSRTWYQLPEAALFTTAQDGTPTGIPKNLVKTQTATTNPLTGYVYPVGRSLLGTVNYPLGNPTPGGSAPFVTDNDATKRIFGCEMGTLLYLGAEIRVQPLQLPGYLMQIPLFGSNQLVSQVQYDVVLHFDRFDPPPADNVNSAYRGHNLMPWSGNGLWYPVQSKLNIDGLPVPPGTGALLTPFQYADFSDIFKIL